MSSGDESSSRPVRALKNGRRSIWKGWPDSSFPGPGSGSGGRSHGGVAVKCSDGSAVYAPFDGKLVGRISPYGNGNKIDNGFKLIGNAFIRPRIAVTLTMLSPSICRVVHDALYSKPNKYTRNVKKGQRIGTLLPMQTAYPGITSHIQMCDRSNLTCYL
ncbi:LECT2 protein, partial [Polyodon spathula]|nr:LECT2 protein [Polyodon spathula]